MLKQQSSSLIHIVQIVIPLVLQKKTESINKDQFQDSFKNL
jgi:hypothetical protein